MLREDDTELRLARRENEGDGTLLPNWLLVMLAIVSAFGFISKLLR